MGSDVTIDRERMTARVGGEVFRVQEFGCDDCDLAPPASLRVVAGNIVGTVERRSGRFRGAPGPAARAICRLVAAAWWSDDSSRGERREDGR
jgi:hypothetical protein